MVRKSAAQTTCNMFNVMKAKITHYCLESYTILNSGERRAESEGSHG